MVCKSETFITPFGLPRTLHIYLPDNWRTARRSWPVLYMFDGHNLFSDADATYGKSWGLGRFLDGRGQPCIVVGVECNHHGNDRLSEYSPYDLRQPLTVHGRGQAYMQWLTGELKPYIDRTYPTLPGRAHTGLMGSSMGGLMSFYGLLAHNRVFSRAGCLSSSFVLCAPPLLELTQSARVTGKTRAFFSWGSEECGSPEELNETTRLHLQLCRLLTQKGAQAYPYLHVGGQHNEQSWEQELPVLWPLLFAEWETI